jgi:Pathogenicity locus
VKQPSRRRKSSLSKADGSRDVTRLEEIPNIGPAIAAVLRQLAIALPTDLVGRDPYAMYEDLCHQTGQRHDPCVLDTFIAAVRFMEGEPKKPWWKYTAERKREMAARRS